MKIPHALVLACASLLPFAAGAQWQWIDGNGKKVFSDRAPPPSVPDKDIVRRAGMPPASASTSTSAGAEPALPTPRGTASSDSTLKPSGVDKELEEKTRRAEEAEKAKQTADAARLAKAKADNCVRARQGKATFDSGIRVARLNAKGEREIMDDKARDSEKQRLQSVIDTECRQVGAAEKPASSGSQ